MLQILFCCLIWAHCLLPSLGWSHWQRQLYKTLCMFHCPTCRKCCRGFRLRTWSILPAWSCCSPHKDGSGLLGQPPTMGGELCPAHGPAGSASSPLAHHAVFAQLSTGLFFPRSGFQGLGGWVFFPLSFCFLRCQASHGRITQKAGEMGKQSNTLLMGEAGLPSLPCLAPHSKVRARLSSDLTAISDPDTAPAVFPTHWFLVAEVWPKGGCSRHSEELQSAENVIIIQTKAIIFSPHSHLSFQKQTFSVSLSKIHKIHNSEILLKWKF